VTKDSENCVKKREVSRWKNLIKRDGTGMTGKDLYEKETQTLFGEGRRIWPGRKRGKMLEKWSWGVKEKKGGEDIGGTLGRRTQGVRGSFFEKSDGKNRRRYLKGSWRKGPPLRVLAETKGKVFLEPRERGGDRRDEFHIKMETRGGEFSSEGEKI